MTKAQLKQKILKDHPELAGVIAAYDTNEILKGLVENKGSDTTTAIIEALVGKIKAIRGDKGDQGEPGYTPKKGVDYFTRPEVNAFLEASTPLKGRDYFTREELQAIVKLATPVKGRDYTDGTSVRGEKGFDGAPGRDGSPDTPDQIASKINTLEGAIDPKAIRGGIITADEVIKRINDPKNPLKISRQKIDMNDMRWHGGGLSAVAHDATLSGNGTSSSPLSVVGAGLTLLSATGTVNGSNTVFGFSQRPTVVISDNAFMTATTQNSTNWTWNAGTLQVTMAVAPQDGLSGLA